MDSERVVSRDSFFGRLVLNVERYVASQSHRYESCSLEKPRVYISCLMPIDEKEFGVRN